LVRVHDGNDPTTDIKILLGESLTKLAKSNFVEVPDSEGMKYVLGAQLPQKSKKQYGTWHDILIL
jgi:hypothetical protein